MINLLVKETFVERWKELDDIEYFDSLRGIDDEYDISKNNRWIYACDDVVDRYFLSKMRIVMQRMQTEFTETRKRSILL